MLPKLLILRQLNKKLSHQNCNFLQEGELLKKSLHSHVRFFCFLYAIYFKNNFYFIRS